MAEFSLDTMKGKDLEAAVIERAAEYKRNRSAHVTRCGVQAVMIGTEPNGNPKWQVIRSLPDFEGVNAQGQQFIFDAKVCSQASFDLTPYREETKGTKSRQLRHMFERSQFNVPCFFLMHWNARAGKTFKELAAISEHFLKQMV
jgi:penicillin-binding protein-related factor A (putative recombinase)